MGYPTTLYRDGGTFIWDGRACSSLIVADEAEKDAAVAEGWQALPDFVAKKPSRGFDHDGDGKPGGSKAPEQADDLAELRIAYKMKHGKRPFGGWDAAEVRRRMGA
ncbi:MAG TPA: hypothetical protein VJ775_01415 [Sphingomicrobium sp.]|nr:hypothetical protein [Sphingomicrobium sp.]